MTVVSQLSNATSVAIVVHGIGDHMPTDILWEASRGFHKLSVADCKVERLIEEDFPHPQGWRGKELLLRIEAAGETHIIVPVIWSGLRFRTSHTALTAKGASNFLGALAAPILLILINAIRCLPKAGPLRWKIAIGIIDLALVALVLGFFVGAIYLLSNIPGIVDRVRNSGYVWEASILLAFLLIVARLAAARFGVLFDFLGDVVAYVGDPDHRDDAERAMVGIVETVAKRAPKANILVISHSLGSVLMGHALAQLGANSPARERLFLVTLGSPFKLMTAVFPLYICSPDTLMNRYRTDKTVRGWANF